MTTTKKDYKELVGEALELLELDDELFVDMVNELDSWNGFADGFRGFPMYEIDDLFYGVKIGDFLDKLSPSFHHTDEYFVDTIYGLDSTDDLAAYYRDNTSAEEVFDELVKQYHNITIYNARLDALIENIVNYNDSDSEEEEANN